MRTDENFSYGQQNRSKSKNEPQYLLIRVFDAITLNSLTINLCKCKPKNEIEMYS